jgi:stage IV sporulation protein A
LDLVESLREEYDVPTMALKVNEMNEDDIVSLLKDALFEFPINEVQIQLPRWIALMDATHWLKQTLDDALASSIQEIRRFKDVEKITSVMSTFDFVERAYLSSIDTSRSSACLRIKERKGLYNEILNEIMGQERFDEAMFIKQMQEFMQIKKEYDAYRSPLKMVKQTGYGVATPSIEDMKLASPEIVKQGPRYGVKLKAVAPSIHMIRVDVESTFEPIIGSEVQSKELIDYLMKDQEKNPNEIWKSEIFGRSLDSIVQEGIQSKINLMPDNIRFKLQTTLSKVVNKGSNNMIAIVI